MVATCSDSTEHHLNLQLRKAGLRESEVLFQVLVEIEKTKPTSVTCCDCTIILKTQCVRGTLLRPLQLVFHLILIQN